MEKKVNKDIIIQIGEHKAKITEIGYIGYGVVYLDGPKKGWSDWVVDAKPVKVISE